jgi:16S rRNA (adenine1518-N6/adenine1519-N6)-dimethyltransferase
VSDLGPQGRSRIRELLDAQDLSPRRSLGQHFLTDPNVAKRIVRTARVDEHSNVVEIGGGTGALTMELAATGARVVVYEIDEGLVSVLDTTVGNRANVEIRHADATRVDLGDALPGDGWVMVANLPYNVGTGILLDALRSAHNVTRFVVMVQTEVADRLFAEPGSKAYGVPSVVVALHGSGGPEFAVRRELFYPRPQVGSTVVAIDRAPAPALAEEAIALAAVAFGQRRKMLRKSLARATADVDAALAAAGVDPTARPEQLSAADFVRIAGAVPG